MITARMVGGPAYQEAIEKIDGELTKIIEEFDRAVDVDSFRRTREIGEYSLSQSLDSSFSAILCRSSIFA